MKRQLLFLVISALILLSGCNSVPSSAESLPENPISSATASPESISSETASSMVESTVSNGTASSELESRTESEPEKADASSAPPPSEPTPSKVEESPASSTAPPSPEPQTVSSVPPEPVPASSENTVPEGRRPMTEAEVDAAIKEDEDFSIDRSGYYLPANSTEGSEIFYRDLFYEVDHLYEISTTESLYEEGNFIYFKIIKGPIEDEENAWYGYVLY